MHTSINHHYNFLFCFGLKGGPSAHYTDVPKAFEASLKRNIDKLEELKGFQFVDGVKRSQNFLEPKRIYPSFSQNISYYRERNKWITSSDYPKFGIQLH